MNYSNKVIIMGTGPAGIATAICCAKAGLSVTIICPQPADEQDIDEEREPLQSVHPGIASLLRELGLTDAFSFATRGTYTGILQNDRIIPLSTVPGEDWTGHHISPRTLCYYMLRRLTEMPVDLITHSKAAEPLLSLGRVSGVRLTNGQVLNCAYLIDASGRKRFAGRLLKLKEEILGPPMVTTTGTARIADTDPRNRQLAQFISNPNGWTWLAYSHRGYTTWTSLMINGKRDATGKVADYPNSDALSGANVQWRLFRPVVSPGLLLAGDAAGVLDPAAGQGILNGLMSGVMAARTVINCIKQPFAAYDFLDRYDRWFVNLFFQKAEMLKNHYQASGISLHN